MGLLSNYQYYAKPEGEDYFTKMCATNKYAIQAAAVIGTFDVTLYSHAKGVIPIASRYMYWLGPGVGMATAFTTVTYAATQLRGKDDKINYFLGAWASASVFGAWQRNGSSGFAAAILFSLAAYAKKVSLEEGWEFFPQGVLQRKSYGPVNMKQHDYSLMPEGEKGWTTKE